MRPADQLCSSCLLETYCETIVNYAGGEAYDPKPVKINNGRQAADLSLQTSGFELVKHASTVSDWQDTEQIDDIIQVISENT